jgi:hypothetical protein
MKEQISTPETAGAPGPDPIYASWENYLARTSWAELRRRCRDTAKRANRKRLLSSAPAHQVNPLWVWRLMSSARGRCAHCGSLAVERRPSDPHKGSPIAWEHVGRRVGSLEHKQTRFGGGDNDLANLAWCCLWCNTWRDERLHGAQDHGGYYPDLRREPGPKRSEAILASKYSAATGKVWSIEKAFAAQPMPLFGEDVVDCETFPEHECPWDIAMLRR